MKIRYNREHKWFSIEHGWLGLYTVTHKWTWGFGQNLRYYNHHLPF